MEARHDIILLMIIELEANQAQIQRILQSKVFRTSEIQRNLFHYLAEKSLAGTADALKEYTIGLDVFAKPSIIRSAPGVRGSHARSSSAAEIG